MRVDNLKELRNRLEVVAVSYVKCKPGCAPEFRSRFLSSLKEPQVFIAHDFGEARDKKPPSGFAVPVLLSTTAGYFDFMVTVYGSSASVLSNYLAEILRTAPNLKPAEFRLSAFGDCVADTHTSIGLFCEESDRSWTISRELANQVIKKLKGR